MQHARLKPKRSARFVTVVDICVEAIYVYKQHENQAEYSYCAALMALWMLIIAERPPDADHEYGHAKAEYFSSGVEGTLIMVAAVAIAWSAINRLLHPQPLENIGLGLAVSLVASAINFGAAQVLLRAGRRHHSILLEADGKHLMTDVWTSA